MALARTMGVDVTGPANAPLAAGSFPQAPAADQVREERTTAACVDQEIADRLAVKRKRRGAVDRLFVKQARHELTALGGRE